MSRFTPIYNSNTNPPSLVNCIDETGASVALSNCLQLGKDECITCWKETNKTECYHKDLTYGSGIARGTIPVGAQDSDVILNMHIYNPAGPTLVETIPINLSLEQWTEANLQVVFNNIFGDDRVIISNVETLLYLGFQMDWEVGIWNDADVLSFGGWLVTFEAEPPATDYLGQFEAVTTFVAPSVRHFRASLWSRCGADGQPVDWQWRDCTTGQLLTQAELDTLSPDCSLEDIGIDLGGDVVNQVVKNPICFFHDNVYYEGWEIEVINPATLQTVNIYATDIDRTIQVFDYDITDCSCNGEVPHQPTAVDDNMGESIFAIPVLVPALSNDVPCAFGQATTWELIPGTENNVTVINNNDGTFLATPIAPGAYSFEYRIFCDGAPTLETAIVTGSTVVFVVAINDPQGNVPADVPLLVDTTGNDQLCPAPQVTTWVIVPGSPTNVTNLVNNNDGTFTFEPGLGPWDFEYEIVCDGNPTGETAIVSGVGIYAVNAVNDLVPPQEFGPSILFDVSTNDTPCTAPLTTTYVLIPGSEVNATVIPPISPDGNFTITPLAEGPYSFQYEIYCDGNPTGETATVNGSTTEIFTITATAGPNGTINPLGATNYTAGSSALYNMTPFTCPVLPPCVPTTIGYGFKENESKYVVFDPVAGGEGTVIDIYDSGGLFANLDGRALAYRASTQQLYVSDAGQDVYAIDVTNLTPSAGNPNLTSLGTISPTLADRPDGSVFYNDVWYVISEAPNIFYAIDPDTLNVISSVPLSGITDARGLAVDPTTGTFYVSDRDQVDFYILNPVTGVTTFCFSSNLGIKGESFSIDSQGQFGYLEESGGGSRIIYRFPLPAACGGGDVTLTAVNTYENYGENIKGLDFSNDGCPPPCYDYEICQVIVDGVDIGIDPSTYIFANIQADHTIHVNFCPVIVDAFDDPQPDVQSGTPQVVDVDENDIVCPQETTTFVLVPGSEINVVVGPPTTSTDGNFNYTVIGNGYWEFTYEIYCDGIPTGETATVSGNAVCAILVNDYIDPSYVGITQTIDVSTNDVVCAAPQVTTYSLVAGSAVNVTVVSNGGGSFDITPGSSGPWSFTYEIACNGVPCNQAVASGDAVVVYEVCAIQYPNGTVSPEDCQYVPEGDDLVYYIYSNYCLPPDDGAGGILRGHFDADWSDGGIYPFGGGSTDAHQHEYDDDFDTSFVDWFNPLGSLTGGGVPNIIAPDQRFKILLVNADINTAGFISINQPAFDQNDPNTFDVATVYDDTPVASLPIYTLSGVAGTTQLTSLYTGYFTDAVERGPNGILPTNTGCVRSNDPGQFGEWRNGAYTVQLVAVDEFGNDLFTVDPSWSNGGQGAANTGTLLYEGTLFWHWDGSCEGGSPCYGDPSWPDDYASLWNANCSGDPGCEPFQICDVIVDGVSVGPTPQYIFYNISADHTITATFYPTGQCPSDTCDPPDAVWVCDAVPGQYYATEAQCVTSCGGTCSDCSLP